MSMDAFSWKCFDANMATSVFVARMNNRHVHQDQNAHVGVILAKTTLVLVTTCGLHAEVRARSLPTSQVQSPGKVLATIFVTLRLAQPRDKTQDTS